MSGRISVLEIAPFEKVSILIAISGLTRPLRRALLTATCEQPSASPSFASEPPANLIARSIGESVSITEFNNIGYGSSTTSVIKTDDNPSSRLAGMEPGQLIKQRREAKGWSQAELGRLVGISQPAIKKIEDGDTSNSRFLPRVAAFLDIPLNDLDPSMSTPSETIPAKRLMGEQDFPIHASAEGGPGQIIVSSDAVDWVPRPAPLAHVPGSYGLLVSGTSMEPEYRPGDTALVNPHLPIIGDEVYIFYAERHGEGRATIKHLRRQAPDAWHVSQWNPPDGGKKDFTLPRREWQWAHRVLGKYSRR